MHISVERFTSDNSTTISLIKIDGNFECFGLEDGFRTQKVYGETRIPAGKYDVTVKNHGGFHNRYKKKFPDFHKGMLEVRDVPNFKDILIHIGNDDDDTEGCLLTGTGAATAKNAMMVSYSTNAYKAFYKKVIDAALANELTISYINMDEVPKAA